MNLLKIKKILDLIELFKKNNYNIFFLIGEMGSGKTFFVKNFLKDKKVSSPTFNYLNIYDDIYHFDLYKLWEKNNLNKKNLETLGFYHSLNEKMVFVEWANLLEDLEKDIKVFSKIVKIFFQEDDVSFFLN